MKSFAELNHELLVQEQEAQRAWIIEQVENTSRTHDEIKLDFIKKYGKQNEQMFDAVVHEIVD